jgi:hypothetical protein
MDFKTYNPLAAYAGTHSAAFLLALLLLRQAAQ